MNARTLTPEEALLRRIRMACCLVPFLLGACGGGRGRPDVLFVLVDTLRADAIGAWGGLDARTPWIDRLARTGTSYVDATSPSSWTLPSAASLLSGLYPSDHGATNFYATVPTYIPVAAEVFSKAGYETGAAVSHHLVGNAYGFARGFGWFDDSEAQGHDHTSSLRITDLAIGWLRERIRRDPRPPMFLLCHYFDPHWMYLAQRFWCDADVPEDPSGNRARYASEVRFLDHELGRLFERIEEWADSRNTIVVFLADHGEAFGEHDFHGHTDNLYQELVHVPLVLSVPGKPANRLEKRTVSTGQLLPTLLELCRVSATLGERSLRPLDEPEVVVSEVSWIPYEAPNAPSQRSAAPKTLVALRDGPWKLIHNLEQKRWELYDLDVDPGETEDCSNANPQDLSRLQAELETWTDLRPQWDAYAERVRLKPAVVENLRSLGYVD